MVNTPPTTLRGILNLLIKRKPQCSISAPTPKKMSMEKKPKMMTGQEDYSYDSFKTDLDNFSAAAKKGDDADLL